MKKITSTYRAVCAIGLIAVAAVALDATVGSLPVEMLSFPLNILLLVLWAAAIGHLYRRRESSAVAQMLLSRGATWLSLAMMGRYLLQVYSVFKLHEGQLIIPSLYAAKTGF